MSAKRLALTVTAALCWAIGGYFMQSAVASHMSFALAAVLSGLFFLAVLLVPLMTVMQLSLGFSPAFVLAALVLAYLVWDWRALVAAIAYASAGALSFAVIQYDHEAISSAAPPVTEPSASDRGRKRFLAAYRLRRPPAADQDPDSPKDK